MGNGLDINEEEFKKMRVDDKLTILYKNTEAIKRLTASYKFELKIHRFMLGILAVLFGVGRFIGVI